MSLARGHGGRRWREPRGGWLALGLLSAALSLASVCRAQAGDEGRDHFALGADALASGRYDEAIKQLEAHADRASPHPDASFNRGLAYVMRVRNNAEKAGDLGRAAAAFEEALAMRADDADAAQALQLVQGEVARRRARRGQDAVVARPTLDRVVIRLASERAWGIAAVVASLLLAVGLALRKRPAGPSHLAGVLLIPASILALALLLPLYVGARQLRLHSKPAVLVVREAYLTDDSGAALGGQPIPEAAKLEVTERRGRLLQVRYGSVEGWLPAATLRVLRVR